MKAPRVIRCKKIFQGRDETNSRARPKTGNELKALCVLTRACAENQNISMTVERMLQLYVANINSVIIWLALLCLGLIAFYLLVSLKGEKLEFETAGGQFAQLEETLKKVLENAQLGGTANRNMSNDLVDNGNVIPGVNPELFAEIEQMKKAVGEKEKEVAALKAQLGSGAGAGAAKGGAGANDGELNAMKKKLKDVEAKLAEYEIIEDDIANLSLYKDENTKLKDEIERIKKGGAVAAPSGAPAAVAAVEAAPIVAAAEAMSPVEDFAASVVANAPVPAVDPTALTGREAEVDDAGITDDLMAEFEAAVSEQKTKTSSTAVPIAAMPIEVAPIPDTPPEPPAIEIETPAVQDLMAEFEAAVKAQKASGETGEEPAAVAAVREPGPVAPPSPVVAATPAPAKIAAPEDSSSAVPSALAGEVDTDQMLSELLGVDESAESAVEVKDDGDRLIAEFENFVKGTG